MLVNKMQEYSFEEIIQILLASDDISFMDSLCFYTYNADDEISRLTKVFLDDYPDEDDDGDDLFSDFILDNDLELFFYGEQFIDVITNLKGQGKILDIDLIISACNYYLENDSFLDA